MLILRDVLGLRAAETAELLGIGLEATNSHLRRARATMRTQLSSSRTDWPSTTQITAEERATLRRYIAASQDADMAGFADLLAAEVVQTMPPLPTVFAGRDAVVAAWASIATGPDRWGDWAVLPAAANRQPAAANYLRRHDDSIYRAFNLDVLTIHDGLVTAVTSFGPDVFPAFTLPTTLPRA